MCVHVLMNEHGSNVLRVYMYTCTCMCVSVWGLCAYVCTLTNRRLGWETQITPSQASTPVPWGPDGGEQRVPKPCDLGR